MPVDGETLLETFELVTCKSVESEASTPPLSVTVQVAVNIADWDAIWAGAVQVNVGVLAAVGLPPVIFQA